MGRYNEIYFYSLDHPEQFVAGSGLRFDDRGAHQLKESPGNDGCSLYKWVEASSKASPRR
jgi:hypothetical protein